MAVTLQDGLFGLTILMGVVLCGLGTYCYRRWDEPGVSHFSATSVLLGLGGIAAAAAAIDTGGIPSRGTSPAWVDIALTGWVLAMVPWSLFALQYTGRYTRFRLRTVVAMSLPPVGMATILGLNLIADVVSNIVVSFVGTLVLLYVFGLATVGSYLVLRTTGEYGHLSLSQGAWLALGGLSPLVLLNSVGILAGETGETVIYLTFALAFATPAVALTVAVFRYDMFESTPAVGALGERAIPRETDDLVFVVDRDDRIIKLNQTAVDTLDCDRTEPLGSPLSDLLGTTVEELQGTETVELETTVGKRRFDPQVTAFTDQHGRRLGYLLSLRDVTDRELRKQRLEVLNRVLRHNLRNTVDVIKSNAETAATEDNREYTDAISDSADGLATLSSKARAIDRLVSRPARESEGDLSAVVREFADADAVTVDAPESAPLVTDWSALRSALQSAIENAVEHAAETVTVRVEELDNGYAIVVADDGPGIPESELQSLDAETETPLQHGTGLGLWQLKWSVTKLNGDLSFDTTDGTTVRMTVPDQSR